MNNVHVAAYAFMLIRQHTAESLDHRHPSLPSWKNPKRDGNGLGIEIRNDYVFVRSFLSRQSPLAYYRSFFNLVRCAAHK
jgi:hypothetical protein